MSSTVWERVLARTGPGRLVVALLLVACSTMADAGVEHGDRAATPPVTPVRLLVFTDGDPTTTAAVRAAAEQRGGAVVSEVRVAPDLVMLVVRVPPEARADLERVPGVREVAPDVAPSPADGAGVHQAPG